MYLQPTVLQQIARPIELLFRLSLTRLIFYSHLWMQSVSQSVSRLRLICIPELKIDDPPLHIGLH